jgi:GNAT superfamily N-acetyltransferase
MPTTETSDVPPPHPYRRRPASRDHLQEVTDFYNVCEIDEHGEPDYDLEEVEEEWSDLDLDRDVLLIETDADELVGSMTVFPRGKGVFDASGYVHPQHQDRGLGNYVVAWAERRALQDANGPVEDGNLLVRSWISTINNRAVQLMKERGYEHVKRFSRMHIELDSPPSPPEFPDGIELLDLDLDRDLEGIYEVVNDSFSEHWSGSPRTFEKWKKFALGAGFEPSLWSQAVRDGRRVGVAIGRNLSGYGWIQWIGVLRDERGKGLGAALMRHQFQQFWTLGITSIDLGVDSENATGALGLYEKVGMQRTKSHDAFEKKIPAETQPEGG